MHSLVCGLGDKAVSLHEFRVGAEWLQVLRLRMRGGARGREGSGGSVGEWDEF